MLHFRVTRCAQVCAQVCAPVSAVSGGVTVWMWTLTGLCLTVPHTGWGPHGQVGRGLAVTEKLPCGLVTGEAFWVDGDDDSLTPLPPQKSTLRLAL